MSIELKTVAEISNPGLIKLVEKYNPRASFRLIILFENDSATNGQKCVCISECNIQHME